MVGMSVDKAADLFFYFFDIIPPYTQQGNFEKTLGNLIQKVENKNVNVSRGVKKGGVLPELEESSSVYKNTSGFVIRDEKIPFIFLPDEISPEEPFGRQIYTLIYLLVCIGLNQYDFYLEGNFKTSILKKEGLEALRHSITTAILFPTEESEKLAKIHFDEEVIRQLAIKYKMTPTAILVTLMKRKVITLQEFHRLSSNSNQYRKKASRGNRRRPLISTAVKKFCGNTATEYVNKGIRTGLLKSIEAQYLVFGRVSKSDYKRYYSQSGI